MHGDNCFVTLTYDEDKLPRGGSLAPKDFQDWLKRFRFLIAPRRIRYYGVGEYGDQTERPHYHVAIFGYPNCIYGRSRYDGERKNCCANCDAIRDSWGCGFVYVGSLETESAQYVCGYVTKKMTAQDDSRLNGRHPEFARMSTRPGIGADAMWQLASDFMKFNLEESEADVPSALRHGSRIMPLGRYLRRKLRTYVGKDEKAPQEVIDALITPEVQAMWDDLASTPSLFKKALFQKALVEADNQRIVNIEARRQIFKERKKL